MSTYKNLGVTVSEPWPYETVGDWRVRQWTLDEVQRIGPSKVNESQSRIGMNTDPDWLGISGGLEKIVDLEQNGWPEGLKKAESKIEAMQVPPLMSFRRKRRRGPQGDSVLIDRLMKGELDQAWEYRRREARLSEGGSKVVTILQTLGGNAHRSGDELFWSGAVACVLAEALVRSGRSVEIRAVQPGTNTYTSGVPHSVEDILVKPAGVPLVPEDLIVVTALAGWFRTRGFLTLLNGDSPTSISLGSHVEIPEWYVERFPEALVIPSCYSLEKAKAVLSALSQQIGVKAA